MNFTTTLRVLAANALLLSLFAGCSPDKEAAPPQRTSRDVIDGMRLKQLTKGLQLTKEQQDQVKPLLAAESKKIAAANEDATLSMTQRLDQYKEFRDETYSKIKVLLTPEQLERLDGVRAQMEGKKIKKK
jgi:Spy/CpxP family protein refolding chaperone